MTILNFPKSEQNQHSSNIVEATSQTFMRDVVQESMRVPVLVDFWAPWCEPCKQLTPVLEKLVSEAGGRIKLVKVNVDKSPEIAGQLGVQSIPAIFAFVQGRPVDGFAGALPESQLKMFIERLIGPLEGEEPSSGNALEQAADALANKNYTAAEKLYSEVLAADPASAPAMSGLARALVHQGKLTDAEKLLASVHATIASTPEVHGALSLLAIFQEAKSMEAPNNDGGQQDHPSLEPSLIATVSRPSQEANLKEQIYFESLRQFVAGNAEKAMDDLLEIIKLDRNWQDQKAKALLLRYFESLGHDHALTNTYRRKLSSLLFS